MENNTEIMNAITDTYKTHTKIKSAQLKEILERDLWFPANKCLELGLVDHII